MPCNPMLVYYQSKNKGKDRIVTKDGRVLAAEANVLPDKAEGQGYISHFATCCK